MRTRFGADEIAVKLVRPSGHYFSALRLTSPNKTTSLKPYEVIATVGQQLREASGRSKRSVHGNNLVSH